MDVGVICLDPTTTSLSIGDQQFEVVNGRAKIPMRLAAELLHLTHRFRVVPLPVEGPAKAEVPADPAPAGDAASAGAGTGDAGAGGPTPADDATDATDAPDAKAGRGKK